MHWDLTDTLWNQRQNHHAACDPLYAHSWRYGKQARSGGQEARNLGNPDSEKVARHRPVGSISSKRHSADTAGRRHKKSWINHNTPRRRKPSKLRASRRLICRDLFACRVTRKCRMTDAANGLGHRTTAAMWVTCWTSWENSTDCSSPYTMPSIDPKAWFQNLPNDSIKRTSN